jgi:hypothetical protein
VNYLTLYGREEARRDLAELRRLRRYWADRRRSPPTHEDNVFRRYVLKQRQMTMALHRRGLRSPYDYEYPRLKQMGKLARELHTRHIVPIENALECYR